MFLYFMFEKEHLTFGGHQNFLKTNKNLNIMKKVMVLLAAFMLLGSVGAFAGEKSIIKTVSKSVVKAESNTVNNTVLVKNYSYMSKCGVLWECENCQEYSAMQWFVVTITLDALCGFPDIDEIDISFP